MRLKDTKTVKAMIDRINAQGGGSGSGQNIAYLAELYEGEDENVFTDITNETTIAELNKVKDTYISTGAIPIIAFDLHEDKREIQPLITYSVYVSTNKTSFKLKVYQFAPTSPTYYMDNYEYRWNENTGIWQNCWTYVGE